MKLNKKNYFSPKNTSISSSKIKDYLLSPQYYKAKHIDHTIVEEPTDAMHIGTMTEMMLDSGTFSSVFSKFNVVVRRSKETEDSRVQVTETMFNEAKAMAEAVMATKAYKQLEEFKKQVVLQSGKLCGMLDFLKIEGDKAIIVDLKTSSTIDEKKYYYHAIDMGYYIQAACYVKLVKDNFPEVKNIVFYHLVVEKDPKKIYRVRMFEFDNVKIKDTIYDVENLVKEISTRKDWTPDEVSLDTALPLRNPRDNQETELSGAVVGLGDMML
jgi:ATP-dependent exoDNAse (exonuclease V) beta subunit